MRKDRNTEYFVRDNLFKATCNACLRKHRCTFCDMTDGPEQVCEQLIEGGTYNCWSCLRRTGEELGDMAGKCDFKCCFFVAKPNWMKERDKREAQELLDKEELDRRMYAEENIALSTFDDLMYAEEDAAIAEYEAEMFCP